MHHRREFLGGLATASLASSLLAQQGPKSSPEKIVDPGLGSMFLTWWKDPTTTMVVQWITAASGCTPPKLQYALKEIWPRWETATVTRKPFPATDLAVHRCELTGLRPGTEYQFRIGEQPTRYRFRTMPAKATDTIQFVSGGDAGTGAHAVATNIIAAKQEPYFALLGGDLAYDNGRSPKTFLKFLENYRKHMVDPQGRLIPMLSCLGNHEVAGGYGKKRSDAPQYLSVFDGLFTETSYGVMDIGDYLSLVLLDSGHLSSIKGEQTSWLAGALAARAERSHLIVANHVPAYPSYRPPVEKNKPGTGAEQREFWCPLFENFKVDVVLEHHDHTFKRTHPIIGGHIDKYGVVYLGDGSWGQIRAPAKPEKRPYLASTSEAYHMTVHRLEGEQRFHVALTDTGRVADVCTTVSKRASRRG